MSSAGRYPFPGRPSKSLMRATLALKQCQRRRRWVSTASKDKDSFVSTPRMEVAKNTQLCLLEYHILLSETGGFQEDESFHGFTTREINRARDRLYELVREGELCRSEIMAANASRLLPQQRQSFAPVTMQTTVKSNQNKGNGSKSASLSSMRRRMAARDATRRKTPKEMARERKIRAQNRAQDWTKDENIRVTVQEDARSAVAAATLTGRRRRSKKNLRSDSCGGSVAEKSKAAEEVHLLSDTFRLAKKLKRRRNKEIQIPGWRIIPEAKAAAGGGRRSSTAGELEEDTSDQAYLNRHLKAEEEEQELWRKWQQMRKDNPNGGSCHGRSKSRKWREFRIHQKSAPTNEVCDNASSANSISLPVVCRRQTRQSLDSLPSSCSGGGVASSVEEIHVGSTAPPTPEPSNAASPEPDDGDDDADNGRHTSLSLDPSVVAPPTPEPSSGTPSTPEPAAWEGQPPYVKTGTRQDSPMKEEDKDSITSDGPNNLRQPANNKSQDSRASRKILQKLKSAAVTLSQVTFRDSVEARDEERSRPAESMSIMTRKSGSHRGTSVDVPKAASSTEDTFASSRNSNCDVDKKRRSDRVKGTKPEPTMAESVDRRSESESSRSEPEDNSTTHPPVLRRRNSLSDRSNVVRSTRGLSTRQSTPSLDRLSAVSRDASLSEIIEESEDDNEVEEGVALRTRRAAMDNAESSGDSDSKVARYRRGSNGRNGSRVSPQKHLGSMSIAKENVIASDSEVTLRIRQRMSPKGKTLTANPIVSNHRKQKKAGGFSTRGQVMQPDLDLKDGGDTGYVSSSDSSTESNLSWRVLKDHNVEKGHGSNAVEAHARLSPSKKPHNKLNSRDSPDSRNPLHQRSKSLPLGLSQSGSKPASPAVRSLPRDQLLRPSPTPSLSRDYPLRSQHLSRRTRLGSRR